MKTNQGLTDLSGMKLLRFGYVLLSVAGADFGLALASLTEYVSPGDGVWFIIIVFLSAVGGVLAAVFWLLRLIWLFVANEPETVPVSLQKLKRVFSWLTILVGFEVIVYFINQPPAERQKIQFSDSVRSVQDSMRTLQQICQSVESGEPGSIMNCVVLQSDRILHFKGEAIGKLDSVSVSNEAFKDMRKEDASKLLSLVKFLNRNFISGLYHDRSLGAGYWLYSYRKDVHRSGITGIRSLYVLNESKDTLNPAFKYYFTILDRKENLLLLAHNDVPYMYFPK